MTASLKARLIGILLTLTLVAWLAAAALTVFSAGRAVEQQIDRQLEQYLHLVTYISRVFARQIDEGLPLYEAWSDNPLQTLFERPMTVEPPDMEGWSPTVNVWLSGKLIAMMDGAPTFDRPSTEGFEYLSSAEYPGRWRVLTRYDAVSELWIRVGVEFEGARWRLLDTFYRELIPLLLLLPPLVLALYFGIARGLKPLYRLARQIAMRKPGLLDPVSTHDVPAEITPVVAEINELMRRLSYALEGEQRFTANASHELLTPLAAIKTEVQLCQRQLQGEQEMGALQRIVDRVDRASHSVNQLLTLARLDPGAPMPTECVRFCALLERVLAETGHLAADHHLSVDFEPGNDLDIEIDGNEAALAILLQNLLVNAFRYAVDASTVSISLEVDNTVSLAITNRCLPIAPEELARVRDRFYRVPGTEVSGSGLGLSIAERVVGAHGARLDISSADDGREFTVIVSGFRRVQS